MKPILLLVAVWAISAPANAIPTHNGSFETGDLSGWKHIGDASAQTSAEGVIPTGGQYAALLSTATGGFKQGYSSSVGVDALPFLYWLGLPTPDPTSPGWVALGDWSTAGKKVAETGGHSGIESEFFLRAGQALAFDWDRVGDVDGDFALFHPADEPFWTGSYLNLSAPQTLATQMRLDLKDPMRCGFSPNPEQPVCGFETGWQTSSFVAPSTGTYTITFGTFDRGDAGWLSALWVDNVRIQVPEPATLPLCALGLFAMGLIRRRTHNACG